MIFCFHIQSSQPKYTFLYTTELPKLGLYRLTNSGNKAGKNALETGKEIELFNMELPYST